MARSKVKLLTSKGKVPSAKLGASPSSRPPSVLMPGQKKSAKKPGLEPAGFDAVPSFGETGLTGRS